MHASPVPHQRSRFLVFFFFNDTATTEIYTLSLHDALPISSSKPKWFRCDRQDATRITLPLSCAGRRTLPYLLWFLDGCLRSAANQRVNLSTSTGAIRGCCCRQIPLNNGRTFFR